MTVMKKKMSIGSTTSSSDDDDSATSLVESNDTHRRSGLVQAERELFRFFNLPLPLEHQHEYSRYNLLQQIDQNLPDEEGEGDKKKQHWWRRRNNKNNAAKDETTNDVENQVNGESTPAAPTQPPPPTEQQQQQQRQQQYSPTQQYTPSRTTPSYRLPPHPSLWPQRPVWIRASPGTSTHIVGIRHVPGDLPDDFGDRHPDLVPVNAGSEQPGHHLVVDFVSKHFVGSLLIRVRGAPSLVATQTADASDTYFGTRQRTFQGVVRGRFRHPQPVYDCLSGQTFRRKAGKLPPQWIIKAFQALLARLAPHSSLELVGPKPRSLAPLVSTTQTIIVTPLKRQSNAALEEELPKPPTESEEQLSESELPQQQAEQDKDNDDEGLLHDEDFFYDSIYDDHMNHIDASNDATTMEQEFSEPHATHEHSLIQQAKLALDPEDFLDPAPPKKMNDSQRKKFRKKYMNKLLSKWKKKERKRKQHQHHNNRDDHNDHHDFDIREDTHLPDFQFTTDKLYTFEFYENLVMFENPQKEFAMNLRLPLLRHIPIAPATDGQPIQMMCAIRKQHCKKDSGNSNDDNNDKNDLEDDDSVVPGWDDELEYLWAFEVWHESLYEYACRAHGVIT